MKKKITLSSIQPAAIIKYTLILAVILINSLTGLRAADTTTHHFEIQMPKQALSDETITLTVSAKDIENHDVRNNHHLKVEFTVLGKITPVLSFDLEMVNGRVSKTLSINTLGLLLIKVSDRDVENLFNTDAIKILPDMKAGSLHVK